MTKIRIALLLIAVGVSNYTTSSSNSSRFFKPITEETKIADEEIALMLLKRWEGLVLKSKWDANAYRIGWGTRSKRGETIELTEADRRAYVEFCKVRNRLKSKYPNLTDWQNAVIAVAAYNVGSFGKGLDKALKSGDNARIARYLAKYVYSKGEKLEGLINRRADEIKLLLSEPEDRQGIFKQLEIKVNQHIRKYD